MTDYALDASRVLDLVTPADLGRGFRISATNGQPKAGRLFSNQLGVPEEDRYYRQQVAKDTSVSKIVSSFRGALEVLSVGGQVSVEFNMISGSGGLEYMSKASSDSTSVDMMFKKSILTEVVELKDIIPHPSVAKLDEPRILSEFGAHYISAIYYGGSIETTIRMECGSSEAAEAVSGNLQASMASPTLAIDAQVYADLEGEKALTDENITAFAHMNGSKLALQKGAAVTDLATARQAIAEFEVDQPSPIGFRVSRITREHLKQFGLSSLQLSAFERLTKKAGEDVMDARELFVRARAARLNIIKGKLSRDLSFRAHFQERFEAAVNNIIADLESKVIRPYFAYLDQPVLEIISANNWPTGAIALLSLARETVTGLEGRGVLAGQDYVGYTLVDARVLPNEGELLEGGEEGGDAPAGDLDAAEDEEAEEEDVEVMDGAEGEGNEAAAAAEDMLAKKYASGMRTTTYVHQQEYKGKSSYDIDGRMGEYVGEWKYGAPHGKGTWIATRGQNTFEYVGDWMAGQRDGQGKYTETFQDDDGGSPIVLESYDGGWQYDAFHGHGKRITIDYEYEGPFENGQKHGLRGVWKDSVSGFYLGEFKNDVMVGDMIEGDIEDIKRLAAANVKKTEDETLPQVEEIMNKIQTQLHADTVFAEMYEEAFLDRLRGAKATLQREVLRPYKKFLAAAGSWTSFPTDVAFLMEDAEEDLAGLRGGAALPEARPNAAGVVLPHSHPTFVGYHLGGVPTYKGKADLEGGQYDGLWLDGQPHGPGKWLGSNGDSFEGQWHLGKRHGTGQYKEPGSGSYEVQYDNGVRVLPEDLVWQAKFEQKQGFAGHGVLIRKTSQRGEALAEEAFEHPLCIGFNSNGELIYALEGDRPTNGVTFYKKKGVAIRKPTLRAFKTIKGHWLSTTGSVLMMTPGGDLRHVNLFERTKTNQQGRNTAWNGTWFLRSAPFRTYCRGPKDQSKPITLVKVTAKEDLWVLEGDTIKNRINGRYLRAGAIREGPRTDRTTARSHEQFVATVFSAEVMA